mgnify:CR=1 FL=1
MQKAILEITDGLLNLNRLPAEDVPVPGDVGPAAWLAPYTRSSIFSLGAGWRDQAERRRFSCSQLSKSTRAMRHPRPTL